MRNRKKRERGFGKRSRVFKLWGFFMVLKLLLVIKNKKVKW